MEFRVYKAGANGNWESFKRRNSYKRGWLGRGLTSSEWLDWPAEGERGQSLVEFAILYILVQANLASCQEYAVCVYRSMRSTTARASGHSLVEAMRGQHLPLSPPDISTLCNLLPAKSTTILCLAMLYPQALSFTPRTRSRLRTASHNGLLPWLNAP